MSIPYAAAPASRCAAPSTSPPSRPPVRRRPPPSSGSPPARCPPPSGARRRRHRGRLPDRGHRPVVPGAGRRRPRPARCPAVKRALTPMLEKLALERRRRVAARPRSTSTLNPRIAQALRRAGDPQRLRRHQGPADGAVPGRAARAPGARVPRRGAARRRGQRRHRPGRGCGRRRRGRASPRARGGDPRFDAAYDAIEAGDWDAAEAAYQRRAQPDARPTPTPRPASAQVALLRRTDGADPESALAAAAAAPDSLEAQALAADIELLTGRVDEAFARIVALVRAYLGRRAGRRARPPARAVHRSSATPTRGWARRARRWPTRCSDRARLASAARSARASSVAVRAS